MARVIVLEVETSIQARDLAFDWLGDASERFHVREHIFVRILSLLRKY